MIPRPPCCLLPCVWPVRDLRRHCTSGGRLRLRALWGFPRSHKGAAEGTEGFVHKGRVCRLGLRLSVDGGLQLLAKRQHPDLVDCEDWAQVGRSGGLCRPFLLGDDFQLLPAVEVEPPCR